MTAHPPCAMCAPKRRHRPPRVLSIDDLRARLDYSEATGLFTWKVVSGPNLIGTPAGSHNGCGYITLQVAGKRYKAHRLAWAFCRDEWPIGDIDHINGNRSDNRIQNLRDVTRSVNLQNQRRPRSDGKSGYLGVTFHSKTGKYSAAIQLDGKRHYLGLFTDAKEAHEAYVSAKRQLHPGGEL